MDALTRRAARGVEFPTEWSGWVRWLMGRHGSRIACQKPGATGPNSTCENEWRQTNQVACRHRNCLLPLSDSLRVQYLLGRILAEAGCKRIVGRLLLAVSKNPPLHDAALSKPSLRERPIWCMAN